MLQCLLLRRFIHALVARYSRIADGETSCSTHCSNMHFPTLEAQTHLADMKQELPARLLHVLHVDGIGSTSACFCVEEQQAVGVHLNFKSATPLAQVTQP